MTQIKKRKRFGARATSHERQTPVRVFASRNSHLILKRWTGR